MNNLFYTNTYLLTTEVLILLHIHSYMYTNYRLLYTLQRHGQNLTSRNTMTNINTSLTSNQFSTDMIPLLQKYTVSEKLPDSSLRMKFYEKKKLSLYNSSDNGMSMSSQYSVDFATTSSLISFFDDLPSIEILYSPQAPFVFFCDGKHEKVRLRILVGWDESTQVQSLQYQLTTKMGEVVPFTSLHFSYFREFTNYFECALVGQVGVDSEEEMRQMEEDNIKKYVFSKSLYDVLVSIAVEYAFVPTQQQQQQQQSMPIRNDTKDQMLKRSVEDLTQYSIQTTQLLSQELDSTLDRTFLFNNYSYLSNEITDEPILPTLDEVRQEILKNHIITSQMILNTPYLSTSHGFVILHHEVLEIQPPANLPTDTTWEPVIGSIIGRVYQKRAISSTSIPPYSRTSPTQDQENRDTHLENDKLHPDFVGYLTLENDSEGVLSQYRRNEFVKPYLKQLYFLFHPKRITKLEEMSILSLPRYINEYYDHGSNNNALFAFDFHIVICNDVEMNIAFSPNKPIEFNEYLMKSTLTQLPQTEAFYPLGTSNIIPMLPPQIYNEVVVNPKTSEKIINEINKKYQIPVELHRTLFIGFNNWEIAKFYGISQRQLFSFTPFVKPAAFITQDIKYDTCTFDPRRTTIPLSNKLIECQVTFETKNICLYGSRIKIRLNFFSSTTQTPSQGSPIPEYLPFNFLSKINKVSLLYKARAEQVEQSVVIPNFILYIKTYRNNVVDLDLDLTRLIAELNPSSGGVFTNENAHDIILDSYQSYKHATLEECRFGLSIEGTIGHGSIDLLEVPAMISQIVPSNSEQDGLVISSHSFLFPLYMKTVPQLEKIAELYLNIDDVIYKSGDIRTPPILLPASAMVSAAIVLKDVDAFYNVLRFPELTFNFESLGLSIDDTFHHSSWREKLVNSQADYWIVVDNGLFDPTMLISSQIDVIKGKHKDLYGSNANPIFNKYTTQFYDYSHTLWLKERLERCNGFSPADETPFLESFNSLERMMQKYSEIRAYLNNRDVESTMIPLGSNWIRIDDIRRVSTENKDVTIILPSVRVNTIASLDDSTWNSSSLPSQLYSRFSSVFTPSAPATPFSRIRSTIPTPSIFQAFSMVIHDEHMLDMILEGNGITNDKEYSQTRSIPYYHPVSITFTISEFIIHPERRSILTSLELYLPEFLFQSYPNKTILEYAVLKAEVITCIGMREIQPSLTDFEDPKVNSKNKIPIIMTKVLIQDECILTDGSLEIDDQYTSIASLTKGGYTTDTSTKLLIQIRNVYTIQLSEEENDDDFEINDQNHGKVGEVYLTVSSSNISTNIESTLPPERVLQTFHSHISPKVTDRDQYRIPTTTKPVVIQEIPNSHGIYNFQSTHLTKGMFDTDDGADDTRSIHEIVSTSNLHLDPKLPGSNIKYSTLTMENDPQIRMQSIIATSLPSYYFSLPPQEQLILSKKMVLGTRTTPTLFSMSRLQISFKFNLLKQPRGTMFRIEIPNGIVLQNTSLNNICTIYPLSPLNLPMSPNYLFVGQILDYPGLDPFSFGSLNLPLELYVEIGDINVVDDEANNDEANNSNHEYFFLGTMTEECIRLHVKYDMSAKREVFYLDFYCVSDSTYDSLQELLKGTEKRVIQYHLNFGLAIFTAQYNPTIFDPYSSSSLLSLSKAMPMSPSSQSQLTSSSSIIAGLYHYNYNNKEITNVQRRSSSEIIPTSPIMEYLLPLDTVLLPIGNVTSFKASIAAYPAKASKVGISNIIQLNIFDYNGIVAQGDIVRMALPRAINDHIPTSRRMTKPLDHQCSFIFPFQPTTRCDCWVEDSFIYYKVTSINSPFIPGAVELSFAGSLVGLKYQQPEDSDSILNTPHSLAGPVTLLCNNIIFTLDKPTDSIPPTEVRSIVITTGTHFDVTFSHISREHRPENTIVGELSSTTSKVFFPEIVAESDKEADIYSSLVWLGQKVTDRTTRLTQSYPLAVAKIENIAVYEEVVKEVTSLKILHILVNIIATTDKVYNELSIDLVMPKSYRHNQPTIPTSTGQWRFTSSTMCKYDTKLVVLGGIPEVAPVLEAAVSKLVSKSATIEGVMNETTGLTTLTIKIPSLQNISISKKSQYTVEIQCDGIGQPLYVSQAMRSVSDEFQVDFSANRQSSANLNTFDDPRANTLITSAISSLLFSTISARMFTHLHLYLPFQDYVIMPFTESILVSITPAVEKVPVTVTYDLKPFTFTESIHSLSLVLPPGSKVVPGFDIHCSVYHIDTDKLAPIPIQISVTTHNTAEVTVTSADETASNIVNVSVGSIYLEFSRLIKHYHHLRVICENIIAPDVDKDGFKYQFDGNQVSSPGLPSKYINIGIKNGSGSSPLVSLKVPCPLLSVPSTSCIANHYSYHVSTLEEYTLEFLTKNIFVDAKRGHFSVEISTIDPSYMIQGGAISFSLPDRVSFSSVEPTCTIAAIDSTIDDVTTNTDIPTYVTTFSSFDEDGAASTQGLRHRLVVTFDETVGVMLSMAKRGYYIECIGAVPEAIELGQSSSYYIELFILNKVELGDITQVSYSIDKTAFELMNNEVVNEVINEAVNETVSEVVDITETLNRLYSSVISTSSANLLSARAPTLADKVTIAHTSPSAGTIGTLSITLENISHSFNKNDVLEVAFPYGYQYAFKVFDDNHAGVDDENDDKADKSATTSRCNVSVTNLVNNIPIDTIIPDDYYYVAFSETSLLKSTVTASTAVHLIDSSQPHVVMIRFSPVISSVILPIHSTVVITCINVKNPSTSFLEPTTQEQTDLFPKATISSYRSLIKQVSLRTQQDLASFVDNSTNDSAMITTTDTNTATNIVYLDTLTVREAYTDAITLPFVQPQSPRAVGFFVENPVLNTQTNLVYKIQLTDTILISSEAPHVTITIDLPSSWKLSSSTSCLLSIGSPFSHDATIQGELEIFSNIQNQEDQYNTLRATHPNSTSAHDYLTSLTLDRLKFTFVPPNGQLLASVMIYLFCSNVYTPMTFSVSNVESVLSQGDQYSIHQKLQPVLPYIQKPHSSANNSSNNSSNISYSDNANTQQYKTSSLFMTMTSPYSGNIPPVKPDWQYVIATKATHPIISTSTTPLLMTSITMKHSFTSVGLFKQSHLETWMDIIRTTFQLNSSSRIHIHSIDRQKVTNKGEKEKDKDRDSNPYINKQAKKNKGEPEFSKVTVLMTIHPSMLWIDNMILYTFIINNYNTTQQQLSQAYRTGDYSYTYEQSHLLSSCTNSLLDNDESDVDCGKQYRATDDAYSCGLCSVGQLCTNHNECGSNSCQDNVCVDL